MSISKKNQELIEKILNDIDWKLIYKFYKVMNRNVGYESIQIPNMKKVNKKYKLRKEHIREEVRSIINYIVENNIPEFTYGPWNLVWINGEWEVEVNDNNNDNNNDILANINKSIYVPILESTLKISFTPLVVIRKDLVNNLIKDDITTKSDEELQKELEKAIKDENYELAAKIRNYIMKNKQQKNKKDEEKK